MLGAPEASLLPGQATTTVSFLVTNPHWTELKVLIPLVLLWQSPHVLKNLEFCYQIYKVFKKYIKNKIVITCISMNLPSDSCCLSESPPIFRSNSKFVFYCQVLYFFFFTHKCIPKQHHVILFSHFV